MADLVFDVGMHIGADTARYLSLGYRVVAVEANPGLVAKATKRFADALASGQLVIEGVGIHNHEGELPFIVNDEVDEWSSFQPHLGARAVHHTIVVPVKPLRYFIDLYGMPHFMKIDVEGMDAVVARQLRSMRERPRFISIEDGGMDELAALYEIGVRQFKFSNQIEAREQFGDASSGAFGDELPGEWLAPDAAFLFYLTSVRPPGQPPINGWWDIHGRF